MKKLLCILSVITVLFTACEKKPDPIPEEPLTLKLSTDSVYCLPIYKDLPALELAWTAGSNHGTGSAIAYTIEMDRTGNKFAKGLKWDIGRTTDRTLVFSHKQLADTLALTFPELPEDSFVFFEWRVRGKVLMTEEEQVSEVAKVAIAWNASMRTDLYIIGDAAPNGWNLGQATPMVIDMTNFSVFSWTGNMNKGEFKLLTTNEDWIPCYVSDENDPTKMHLREKEEDYPDFKWIITSGGIYTIDVNVKQLKMTIIPPEEPEKYSHIYMIGDVTPGGWSWDYITEMDHPERNIFEWKGHLNSGEIKFPTEIKNDWSGEMLYAPTPDCAPSAHGTYDIHSGDPDNKWRIQDAGDWQIRINFNDATISFVKQ